MIAEEYGRALFSLAEEMNISESVLSDLTVCAEALRENPVYKNLIDSPAIPAEEKLTAIREAFSSLTEPVLNLLMILAEGRDFYLIPGIKKSYEELYYESRGILRAEVISATVLTEEQKSKLVTKLEGITGKKIKIKCTVDKSLIGGLQLRYGGIQLDGSIKSRLDEIEKRLANAVI